MTQDLGSRIDESGRWRRFEHDRPRQRRHEQRAHEHAHGPGVGRDAPCDFTAMVASGGLQYSRDGDAMGERIDEPMLLDRDAGQP
jgi:hypothetical protein